jgi:hypothetical protein
MFRLPCFVLVSVVERQLLPTFGQCRLLSPVVGDTNESTMVDAMEESSTGKDDDGPVTKKAKTET